VVIILNVASRTVGMVVDSVSDVLALRTDQIKPAPEFNGSIDSTYITGLGTVKSGDTERMLILMDIEQMMSSAEMGLMDQFSH
jgi:purine-binding chemotaxis protein CheW